MERATERRQSLRYPIRVRIRLQLGVDPAVIHSQTGDLSEGGLHFLWMQALAKGSPLRVTLPILDRAFKMTGRVAYSNRDVVTGLFRIGVAFREPSSAFRMKLAEEILRIQKFREEYSQEEGYEISDEEAAVKWIQKYSREFAKIYK